MNKLWNVQYWSDKDHMWVSMYSSPWRNRDSADYDLLQWSSVHPDLCWRVVELTDRCI